MAAVTTATPPLNIGRLFQASIRLIQRRWLAMLVFLLIYWALQIGGSLTQTHPKGAQAAIDLQTLSRGVAISLAWACAEWLRDSAIVASAVLPSPRPPIIAPAAAAIRSFPTLLPYRLIAILPELAVRSWERWMLRSHAAQIGGLLAATGLATMLFDLGLAAAWGLIIPVAIAERCGPLGAMPRSWTLLAGNRWRLVGLSFGFMVAGVLPTIVVMLLGVTVFRGEHFSVQQELWVASLLGSLITVFWLAITVAAYEQLVRTRGGLPGKDSIDDIFG
jgi:hypothetical protein